MVVISRALEKGAQRWSVIHWDLVSAARNSPMKEVREGSSGVLIGRDDGPDQRLDFFDFDSDASFIVNVVLDAASEEHLQPYSSSYGDSQLPITFPPDEVVEAVVAICSKLEMLIHQDSGPETASPPFAHIQHQMLPTRLPFITLDPRGFALRPPHHSHRNFTDPCFPTMINIQIPAS